ncbi:MAG: MipA/OmpV family protein [Bacteriovoracaceae bacterium]|nr:MipA/OmpV family protein [Bacteriovoracaceae bacterium]
MNTFWTVYILLTLNAAAQITRPVDKEAPPLIELGAGIASFYFPDYAGAEHGRVYTFPFPTGIIRGENFRVDEEGGARGRFVSDPKYELSLSGSLTFASDAKDNPVRTGMPDLDSMIELGPSILYHFKRWSADSQYKVGLALPVRLAFATDFKDTEDRGLVFNPFLYMIKENLFQLPMIFLLGLDARWATERYMDYYYQVDPAFQTGSRPAYDAKAGLLQTSLVAAFSYTFFKEHTIFIAGQWATVDGSQIENSPLVVNKQNFSWAVGYTWWFYKSPWLGVR